MAPSRSNVAYLLAFSVGLVVLTLDGAEAVAGNFSVGQLVAPCLLPLQRRRGGTSKQLGGVAANLLHSFCFSYGNIPIVWCRLLTPPPSPRGSTVDLCNHSGILHEADDAVSDIASPVFDVFGFTAGGTLHVQADVTPENRIVHLALFRKTDWDDWYGALSGSRNLLLQVCQFPSVMRIEASGSVDFLYTVEDRAQYTLQVLACRGGTSPPTEVKGYVTLLNPSLGERYSHLSLEMYGLDVLYFSMLGIHLIMTAYWVVSCYFNSNRRYRRRIHELCLILLVSRCMDILLSGLHFASLGTAAEVNIGLYQAHQVASALTTALFLLAMLLIALGWKITRVSLAPKELQMLSVSFALYTVVAVAVAFCETPQACSALQLAEYVMRSLMMLGIIIAMNFNITHVRGTIHDSPWAPSLPSAYKRLNQFHSFRWTFLAYLLLPTMILIFQITILTWRFIWVSTMMSEILLLYVYFHIGFTFRPRPVMDLAEVASQAAAGEVDYVGVGHESSDSEASDLSELDGSNAQPWNESDGLRERARNTQAAGASTFVSAAGGAGGSVGGGGGGGAADGNHDVEDAAGASAVAQRRAEVVL